MMHPLAPVGDGHTELSDDDREGLLLSYISTRGELNDAEQRNIVEATQHRRTPRADELLDDRYLRSLHQAMFGQVWSWAGRYRTLQTNLGVEPIRIASAVRDLVADARAWIEYETFPTDEIGVRFHHRLVFIHPFPNGNGRHGRIAADYLTEALGHARYTWGIGLDLSTADLRAAYLSALQRADRDDIGALKAFARS